MERPLRRGPSTTKVTPAVLSALSLARTRLQVAERQIADQAATINKLQQRVSVAEHRAALAESATKEIAARAYRFATAAGLRR